ncbi:SurA N-terminal domain-containing protein [Acuticoccus sp. M5D2P5]|uniref:peptidylprolyl isomerase n=1 Tax=Acuticoccus kalidii TaxID=2910977 RepID=UPI001F400D08|nr:peptidylprolyl isomerase [Acuticoccus kalidii]MCF3933026.1 SurA N-terminal domain-containing protein [Acuticoccus kalidii]
MLNALRRGAKGIFAKILIALLVMSFAVWGISGFVNQINPSEVARAGDTPVSAQEYARVYQLQSNRLSQQLGQSLTPQQAQTFGLPQQVLQSLVTEALQVDAAHKLGIDLSDDALAARIRDNPAFAGPNGSFDRSRFDRLMADNGYTEAQFIEQQRAAAAQEMWVNGLIGGVSAPTPYLQAFNRYANQSRTVEWFALDESVLDVIEDPSEETLRAFYDENASEFRAPERRTFSIVTLTPAAIAEPDAVSDEAVQRAYDVPGAYGAPERRRVQQVVLSDMEIAQKAADALNEGTAFSAILSELDRKFEDVDLGLVQRSALVDPAVAEAAFELPARGAAAIEGRFGPVLVRVSEIEEADKRPFDEVKDEIRQTLALEEAAVEVRTIYDNVEDAVAGGASIAELAERFDLPSETYDLVTRAGIDRDGNQAEIPQSEQVLETAFGSEPGDDAIPVRGDDAYVWVQTDATVEAAEQPFEDVSGDVLVAWTAAEKAKRLDAIAEEAAAAVKGGTPIADVAAQYGVTLNTTEPFSQGNPPADLPQPAPAAAFEGPLGHADSVIAEDGRHVVLKVAEVSEPVFFEEAADLQQMRNTLNDGTANTILLDFVNGWQARVGATVNQPVLNQIIGVAEGS